ncbi:MAG TPA: type III PLP-dependent enzyme [Atribacteraceae bacterium]|nr:type III PLP-dependent enzyme [Atribacteraceae bacterium]
MEKRALFEKELLMSTAEISALVEKYDTPLFIISREKLATNHRALQEHLPGVELFYAIKANPHPAIIQQLYEAGTSFDVASKNEIDLALRCGVPPERMIFANTIKRKKSLRYARQVGIDLITYDNANEVSKMASEFPGVRVVLRLKTSSEGSRIDLSYKFGAEPEEAMDLLRLAAGAGLKPVGISFHVGSPCHNPQNYLHSLDLVRKVIRDADRAGISLHLVDIGGGFPLHITKAEDSEASLEMLAETVGPVLQEMRAEGLRIIAEPGRVLVGSACLLVTKVIGKAVRSGRIWYYLDDGIYGTFSAILFDKARFHFVSLRESPAMQPCVLAGPTCDSLDVIAEDVFLPPLELDDQLFVPDIGAYSWASSTTFNGFDKPTVVLT